MKKTVRISKYILSTFIRTTLYYYIGLLSFILFALVLDYALSNNSSFDMNIKGFGISTNVLLLIIGLNAFKSNFMFTQANNIPRKKFYMAFILSTLTLSAILAVFETLTNNILPYFIPTIGLMDEIYHTTNIIADFLWSFSIFCLSLSIGWLIALIYYRSSKPIKIIVSFAPVFVILLFVMFNQYTNGLVFNRVGQVGRFIFSLDTLNPFLAAIHLFFLMILVFLLSYPLIAKAIIKE